MPRRSGRTTPAGDRPQSPQYQQQDHPLQVLRRILEDAAQLKDGHFTEREVVVLREAYDKVMKAGDFDATHNLATQCDNVLWQLEKKVESDPVAKTGDADAKMSEKEKWVFDVPMARRRQTLAITLLNFFTTCPLLLILGIVLTIWPLTMPFMIVYWIIIFWGVKHPLTAKEWWVSSSIWIHFRDYFPIRLIIPKRVRQQIKSPKNYIFCYHPHGVHSFGALVNFGSRANKIHELLPGVTIHPQTLSANFRIPFWREMCMWGGSGDASAKCIRDTLRSGPGQSVLLVVGGAEESLLSSPKTNDLTLSKRRGFVKLALEVGAGLVPVFGFGETNTYDNYADGRPWLQKLLKKMQKKMGFAIPLIKGRSWFYYGFGPLPHRRPVITVVGAPVVVPKIEKPTKDDIDHWHAKYVEALLQLYNDNREIYAQHVKRDARVVT